jgi:hypothetical protein
MTKRQINLAEFHSASTVSILPKADQVRNIIGDAHWLSDGTYKESLIRKALRETLPSSVQVGHGFIVSPPIGDDEILVSKQIDCLVYSSQIMAPIFQDEDFVIILSTEAIASIEVKSKWSYLGTEIKEALENLNESYSLCKQLNLPTAPALFNCALTFENEYFRQKDNVRDKGDPTRIAKAYYECVLENDIPRDRVLVGSFTGRPYELPVRILCSLNPPAIYMQDYLKYSYQNQTYNLPIITTLDVGDGTKHSHSLHVLMAFIQHTVLDRLNYSPSHEKAVKDQYLRYMNFYEGYSVAAQVSLLPEECVPGVPSEVLYFK